MTRRRRPFNRLTAFYFLLVLGLMVGGSLWIDGSNPVLATVSGKTEQIQFSFVPQGGWYRWYRVGVTFSGDNGPGSATVEVPPERFDALEPGDTISIRYLAAFPLFARTADRSTILALRAFGARVLSDQVLAPLLLWLGAGIIVLVVASRVNTSATVIAGLLWIGAAFPVLFPAPRSIRLAPAEGQARVAAISVVDRAPERWTMRRMSRTAYNVGRLKAPYQVVQLRVPMSGRTDSVLAVDAVDTGSVRGLTLGAIAAIRYDPGAPRLARLSQGTRTFRARNRFHFLVPVVGAGLLGMFGVLGWRHRRSALAAAR